MTDFQEVAMPYRPLVVFDFDHTLYDGDSGSHLVMWLIRRHWWRKLAALLAAPVLLPMVAWLPTRRRGISGFLWVATFGTHGRAAMDRSEEHTSELQSLMRLSYAVFCLKKKHNRPSKRRSRPTRRTRL